MNTTNIAHRHTRKTETTNKNKYIMSNLTANEDVTPGKCLVQIGDADPCVYNVLQMPVHKLEAQAMYFLWIRTLEC